MPKQLQRLTTHLAIVVLSVASGFISPQTFANPDGEALFNQRCAACHQPGGVGTPGLAPPLVNARLWSGLGDQAQAYFFGVLNNGMSGTIEVNGVGYYGLVMSAQADLSDTQMLDLADYVLKDLNKLDFKSAPEMLKTARSQSSAHSALREIRKNAS